MGGTPFQDLAIYDILPAQKKEDPTHQNCDTVCSLEAATHTAKLPGVISITRPLRREKDVRGRQVLCGAEVEVLPQDGHGVRPAPQADENFLVTPEGDRLDGHA